MRNLDHSTVLELKVADLRAEVDALKEIVEKQAAELRSLVRFKATAEISRAPAKLRGSHGAKDEFMLAAYLSELSYFTKPPRTASAHGHDQPGLDFDDFKALRALRELPAKEAYIADALEAHPFVDPPSVTKHAWHRPLASRIAEGFHNNLGLVMLSHEQSSPAIDAQV